MPKNSSIASSNIENEPPNVFTLRRRHSRHSFCSFDGAFSATETILVTCCEKQSFIVMRHQIIVSTPSSKTDHIWRLYGTGAVDKYDISFQNGYNVKTEYMSFQARASNISYILFDGFLFFLISIAALRCTNLLNTRRDTRTWHSTMWFLTLVCRTANVRRR